MFISAMYFLSVSFSDQISGVSRSDPYLFLFAVETLDRALLRKSKSNSYLFVQAHLLSSVVTVQEVRRLSWRSSCHLSECVSLVQSY